MPYIPILVALVSVSIAAAQSSSPAGLDEQLRTQYKIVKLSHDSAGITVAQPGSVLVLQKGGLLGVPPQQLVVCPAKFQDGELHPPTAFCAGMVKKASRSFQAGEKVYPTKIDVNLKKEQVSFHLVACDSCNGTDPATFFKAEVQFQFPAGYLETTTPEKVEDTVDQVLAIEGREAKPAAPPAPPPAPPAPVAAPAPPVDQPTKIIALGQTFDQVVAAFGKPQKIAKVGAKEIYFYPDMKVTFTNGKVSDVE